MKVANGLPQAEVFLPYSLRGEYPGVTLGSWFGASLGHGSVLHLWLGIGRRSSVWAATLEVGDG